NSASSSAIINPNLDLGGLTRTFTVADGAANHDLQIGHIIQNGGLTKAGAGALELVGGADNTYTGLTTVSGGTLELVNFNSVAVPGTLIINGGIVREFEANQIANTSDVIVNTGGTFDLNGKTDTIGPLSVGGGSVTTGTGTLTA